MRRWYCQSVKWYYTFDMATCLVCGGVNFEKHAGFLYCSECQTQSQDYHEEEYQYRELDSAIRKAKSSSRKSSKGQREEKDDSGEWTSWELFNYVLFGMTQELKLICENENFESTVLRIWACYLNKIQAGFLSIKTEDVFPKLSLNFRKRDAKILYNLDAKSLRSTNSSRRGSKRKKKVVKRKGSNISNTSILSMSSFESKRMQTAKRTKIISKEYENSLSRLSGDSTLANETLESLGRTSDESSFLSEAESKASKKLKKFAFTKNARKIYEKVKDYDRRVMTGNGVQLTKYTLLSVIQLALIVVKSDIHLGDLLRFIKEGHLSYAKVTHFLPKEIKIPRRKDSKLFLTESDCRMPNHFFQRGYVMNLVKLLGFEKFPQPDVESLIRRYCSELKLPDQIVLFSIRIVRKFFHNYKSSYLTAVRVQKFLNIEGIAMGCIIIVLKFYFGLDDKIEIILSHFAKTVNKLKNGADLFVFEDWQKYIECRNTIIKDFHYPTQERFDSDHYDSHMLIDTLIKESKDDFIADRFCGKIYCKSEFQKGVQDIASGLADTSLPTFIEFPPSFTPHESYIKIIKEKAAKKELDFSTAAGNFGEYERNDLPWNVLNMEFKNCDITFTRNPLDSIKLLEENNFKVVEVSKLDLLRKRDVDGNQYTLNGEVLFVIVDGSYWILRYTNCYGKKNKDNFTNEIFDKLSNNLQWLLTECARIIENDVRELYLELNKIESKLFRI